MGHRVKRQRSEVRGQKSDDEGTARKGTGEKSEKGKKEIHTMQSQELGDQEILTYIFSPDY